MKDILDKAVKGGLKKNLLFSLTKNVFEMQTFRCGGKGGQKQNKTSSGVRIIHHDSGARGESREERNQSMNKKLAFDKLTKSARFKVWHTAKVNEILSEKSIEQKVDEMMSPDNLRIETMQDGKWSVSPINGQEVLS